MKALLVIAHGSRVTDSNHEIETLTGKLREAESGYDLIGHAFLEMASPGIADGASHLINQGATTVTVLPYFLVAGNHVLRDVPEEIDALRQNHPGTSFTISNYFGAASNLPELLLQHIQMAN